MCTSGVNFRIPEELIEKAGVATQITHKNQTEIVTEALQNYPEDIEAPKQEIIELYLNEQIGRQNAKSVRA
ncbi:MAG: hypothetical protein J07HQW1_00217 [Haloquadratum walsbyi J07HQW1]|uniref:Uncharacterized protein n=1 Tax=Haloquadratum walsbyi J07HQW1 TaxID=1238424 RepID=U1N158_9EURY|nr:MAG: hypothetical protein J07HQW1_00217 [Haloquadratum walsbyi J07HQW1]